MKNEEVKSQLLALLLEALAKKVITQPKPPVITAENYLITDYFTFQLNDKQYNVTFKDKFNIPGKQIELIRRGSNFVKDLLHHIFNNYNLLYIFNATTSFTLKDIAVPPTVHGMIMTAKNVIGDAKENVSENYQYQINFLINIRDTITGFTTNQKIISGLSVEYNDKREPVYHVREFSYPENDVPDEAESIQIFQTDTLAKLKFLTATLRTPEEKERILEAFRANSSSDLYRYIHEREELARNYRNYEVTFEYNVTPITIYAIKSKMKIVNFQITYGNMTGNVELLYNHAGEVKYWCPHCNREMRTMFVYAKAEHHEHGEYILACQECASRLDHHNSVYHDDGWYLNDNITTCKRTINGEEKELKVLKSDTGVCEIDHVAYYREDLIVYNNMRQGSNWVENTEKHVVNRKYALTCRNCNRVLVTANGEGLYQVGNRANAACFACVNRVRDQKIRREFVLSEISGTCFPAQQSEFCSNCGKVMGRSERVVCRTCGEVVCAKCHKENVCLHCDSALRSDLTINKFIKIWREIKANVRFSERRKNLIRIDIHPHRHSTNNELRVVVNMKKGRVMYYFHDCAGHYVYKGRRKV